MAFDDLVGKNPELESVVSARLDVGDTRSALEQLKANGYRRHLDAKADRATMILYPDAARRLPQSLMYFRTEQIFVYLDSWIVIVQPNTSWQAGRLE